MLYTGHVNGFRAALRRKFSSTTKGLTEDDVDDAIQDAFARVLGLLRSDGPALEIAAAYLFAAARNSCVSKVRSLKLRNPQHSVEEHAQTSVEHELCDSTDESADACSWVALYLASAPPDLVDVYELRFIEGLAQHVCARRLGMSRKRVRTREALLIDGLRAFCASAHGRVVSRTYGDSVEASSRSLRYR
jgi:RNA polymerase sigma factor (sigma-70 family)